MGNYRDFLSRTECLLNALVWSLILALQIIFFLKFGRTIDTSGVIFYVLLLLIQLAAALFHWYRYLVYNKKATK